MLDEINSFIKYASTFDELSAQKNQDLGKSNISVEKFIKSTSKLSKVNDATRNTHAKTYATGKISLKIEENLPYFLTEIDA